MSLLILSKKEENAHRLLAEFERSIKHILILIREPKVSNIYRRVCNS